MSDSTLTQAPSSSSDGVRRCAYLYLALDCAQPAAGGARFGLDGVSTVQLGRSERRSATRDQSPAGPRLQLGLSDRWMSTTHARLERIMGRWVLEDQHSKNGVRVNGQPVTRAELNDGDLIEVGRTFLIFRAAQLAEGSAESPGEGEPTLVPDLLAEFEKLRAVASSVPVLICGETGTGKELAAREVHLRPGRTGPFVPVNCGALPKDLVESQLFGHVKGAFTGATEDRQGLVRSAHKGTLFLDEVAELPLAAQPVLLRVLQEREVFPVGATRGVPVDIQLVAATHRDLDEMVDAQSFRADLLARLAGFTLALPPLRERPEDSGLIVAAVLRRANRANAALSLEAGRALFAYDWPLNIRELEKALQLAAALAADKPIELAHLPETVRAPRAAARRGGEDGLREQLVTWMREHHGNVSAVARASGKARMQVQRWLKRFGLDPASFR